MLGPEDVGVVWASTTAFKYLTQNDASSCEPANTWTPCTVCTSNGIMLLNALFILPCLLSLTTWAPINSVCRQNCQAKCIPMKP